LILAIGEADSYQKIKNSSYAATTRGLGEESSQWNTNAASVEAKREIGNSLVTVFERGKSGHEQWQRQDL
jgi:hypothetical protein